MCSLRKKGANTAQVELLDQGLANLAHAIMQYNGRDIERIPGTGAAGGTGGGMLGLFNTTVRPGIELVLDLAHGREACAWADVIITGEGSIDSQTPYGKVPSGIAKLAQSQGKPTIAIGGTVTRDPHTIEALSETRHRRNVRHCARAGGSCDADRQHRTQCRDHVVPQSPAHCALLRLLQYLQLLHLANQHDEHRAQ